MNSLVIAAGTSGGGFNPSIILMAVLFIVLIFMMFRGRKKQTAQQEKMKTGTVPGAKVMTNSGIFGTVVGVDAEDRVQVEVSPGVVLTLHRQAVTTFLDNTTAATAPAAPEASADTVEPSNPAETPEETMRRLNDEGKN